MWLAPRLPMRKYVTRHKYRHVNMSFRERKRYGEEYENMKYETLEDKNNEGRLFLILSGRWHLSIVPTEEMADYDAVARGDGLRLLLEYKHRPEWATIRAFPTYMLSWDKFLRVRDAARHESSRFVFVFSCADMTYWWIDLTDRTFIPRLGGRTVQTRWEGDIEKVIDISTTEFKPISTIPVISERTR